MATKDGPAIARVVVNKVLPWRYSLSTNSQDDEQHDAGNRSPPGPQRMPELLYHSIRVFSSKPRLNKVLGDG